MKPFDAVIFDMDGTLVNNMTYHENAWMAFLEKNRVEMTKAEFEEKHYGTIDEVVPRIIGDHLSAEEIKRLGDEKEAIYRELYRPHIEEIKGLTPFLKALRQQAYPLALATMGDRNNIAFTLENLKLHSFFEVIISGEEVRKGKPAPEIFLKAAARLKVPAERCLVFEDSISGIEAARHANMQVAAITTTHPPAELPAGDLVCIIDNFLELQPEMFF
jgi:beta-phosphoglucomutase